MLLDSTQRIVVLEEWDPNCLQPGAKLKALVRVASRYDGTLLGLPMLAARGTSTGPTLLAVGGVHGDEFEGGEAIRRFWQALDASQLAGTFVGVPAANVGAYETRHRANMLEHMPQDMGRVLRSGERGYLSGLIAAALWEQVGIRSQAIVDLHSAGMLLAITPCVIYYTGGSGDGFLNSRTLAERSGLPILREAEAQASGSLSEVSCFYGVPAIAVEIGGEGRCDDAFVDLALAVLRRTAATVGLLEHNGCVDRPQVVVRMHFTFSREAGFFKPTVGLKERVREGQIVGIVSNAYGTEVERIQAPIDGIAVLMRTYPSIMPADLAVGIGEVLGDVTASALS